MNKTTKHILSAVSFILLLTLLWNIVLDAYLMPKYFTQVEAKVVDIQSRSPVFRGGGRQVNHFPTYEYTDSNGEVKQYRSNDGFNRVNGVFFEKEVGDTVTAYYEKDGPQDSLMVTKTGDWWTFRAAPIILMIMPGLPILALTYGLYKLVKKL